MVQKTKNFSWINWTLMAISVFGLYVVFSLFEVWALFPFWIKNLCLFGSLIGIYFYARKILKEKKPKKVPINPGFVVSGVLVVLALGYGIFQAGPALPGLLIQIFTISLKQPPKEVLLSLEAIPPAHTDVPPKEIISFSDGPVSRVNLNELQKFPEGTVLNLAIRMEEKILPIVSLGQDWVRAFPEGDLYTASQVLNEDAKLNIQVGPYVSVNQEFEVIPDDNPIVAFRVAPEISPRQSLKISAEFKDDYGVEELFLEIAGGNYETVSVPLPFVYEKGKTQAVSYLNLLDDKRAGLPVSARLVAYDGLGQRAESEKVLVSLPEKGFDSSLGREIIDIRKALLNDPNRFSSQTGRIENLTQSPGGFEGSRGVYLALRSIYWRIRSAETTKDIEEVSRLLWQTALTLEEPGTYEEQDLRALLEEMTEITMKGGDIRPFEQTAVRLRRKADTLFRNDFRQTQRRFSFNAGVDTFEIPQVGQFRELTRKIEFEATENNREEVLKTLIQARDLFEDLGALRKQRPFR